MLSALLEKLIVVKRATSSPLVRLILFVAILTAAFFSHVIGIVGGIGLVLLLGFDVERARESVWDAACKRLDGRPSRAPHEHDEASVPAAVALEHLASAIDAARREAWLEAHEIVPKVDRQFLRPEEARLLDAVRAMIELSLGNNARAILIAGTVVPTGSDDFDTALGRAMVKAVWNDTFRLERLDAGWARAGIRDHGDAPLERLRAVIRARVDHHFLEGRVPTQLRIAADEARAIGEESLAVEITSKSSRAYR